MVQIELSAHFLPGRHLMRSLAGFKTFKRRLIEFFLFIVPSRKHKEKKGESGGSSM